MRVYINPIYTSEDRADGGIRRVSDAQVKYLPALGWDVTNTPEDADVGAERVFADWLDDTLLCMFVRRA